MDASSVVFSSLISYVSAFHTGWGKSGNAEMRFLVRFLVLSGQLEIKFFGCS